MILVLAAFHLILVLDVFSEHDDDDESDDERYDYMRDLDSVSVLNEICDSK